MMRDGWSSNCSDFLACPQPGQAGTKKGISNNEQGMSNVEGKLAY
jgi:hypothetical protein